jgi:hypothetical protein
VRRPARLAAAFTPLAQAAAATPEQLERLREILARPEFETAEDGAALESLLARLMSALRSLLANLFPGPGPNIGGAGDLLEALWIGLALLVCGIALFVFVRAARGALASEAELRGAAPIGPPTADAELALARRHAEAGDLRRAVHHHYVAVLRRLDERGALRFDAALTNREHLGRAGSTPGVVEALEPLVAAFDRLWYGQTACSASEYQEFRALAERAWQGA